MHKHCITLNNDGFSGINGLYKARPEQSIVLLVDFETSNSETLDAIVKALQPLPDGGYYTSKEDS